MPGAGTDLNTGVLYLRAGRGALAMVQSWRKAMLGRKGDKHLNENVNDQSLFNNIVRGYELGGGALTELVAQRRRDLPAFDTWLRANGDSVKGARRVFRSHSPHAPCLPDDTCEKVPFTFSMLPMRAFTGGHAWFNQNVGEIDELRTMPTPCRRCSPALPCRRRAEHLS